MPRIEAGRSIWFVVLCAFAAATTARLVGQTDSVSTRWTGLQGGPFQAGFEIQRGVDPIRRDERYPAGVPMGLAIWYPSLSRPFAAPLTSLDYRLNQFFTPRTAAERARYATEQVEQMVVARHVGIVELTRPQAEQALLSAGRGFAGLAPAAGRRPVVLLMGGPYSQTTTAELLASHGFLVAAPFRFIDRPLERGNEDDQWYFANNVRDAEWAIARLGRDERRDPSDLIVLGHGGGGAQAILTAMSSRAVTAIANIDAGNFSARSGLRRMAVYDVSRVRVPYLYVATRETRSSQDQFEDFVEMNASARYEVALEGGAIRHHDLSDLGRGVTASGLRGVDQTLVASQYAAVQDLVVRFALDASGRGVAGQRFADWLAGLAAPGRYTVTIRPAERP